MIVGVVLICGQMAGQVRTRAEEIEAARRKKEGELKPDELSRTEQILNRIKDEKLLERLTSGVGGVRLKFGALATGSGFAIGPEYLRRDLRNGTVLFRAAASASTRHWTKMEIEFGMPKLRNNHVFWDLTALRHDYAGVNYYGPGPDSVRSGRTNYRLEETSFNVAFGVSPVRYLKLGLTGGYSLMNVGPGTDSRFASTDRTYSELLTPGIQQQTNFLRGGLVAQYDWRDNPGGPRRGGNYLARYTYNGDRDLKQFTFRRLDLELQQYFPFFNQRRVIALRGKSSLTYPNSGQRVPFYLQPTVGGSEDVRGFRPYRFYDNNSLVFNGEYRWEVFSGLDMALFADAGKVFRRHAQWNLQDLEGSYGFGFRFNVRNDVFMRVDVGFSHEGLQLWLKFNNVF